jgi:hypothetical protein
MEEEESVSVVVVATGVARACGAVHTTPMANVTEIRMMSG